MFLTLTVIGIGVTALAHMAPFPFLLEYFRGDRSLWHVDGEREAPTIYLTYDDGPNPEATPALLDVLARENVKATFFIIPRHLTEETAPIVARIFEEGHAVALHSHTRALLLASPDGLARQLADQAARIEELAGHAPCRLFRPHAGWRGGQMYSGLDRAGYVLVGWSFAMWDWNWWRPSAPERLSNRLAARASDGDIIVMHDGHHENPRADRQQTVTATAALTARLKAKGFQFGRLCPESEAG